MADHVRIDEKYTYIFDEGRVEILRYYMQTDAPSHAKAWIAAAAEIERLRAAHEAERRALLKANLAIKRVRDKIAAADAFGGEIEAGDILAALDGEG